MPAQGAENAVDAIVVLGCRPVWSETGCLEGALGRRVHAAGQWFVGKVPKPLVVVTGGRTWNGVVEADAMCDELVRLGVDASLIVRERCSLTTRDNARLSGVLLARLRVGRVTIVTCDWHIARASLCFRRESLAVETLPVPSPEIAGFARFRRGVHEWAASRLDTAARGPA